MPKKIKSVKIETVGKLSSTVKVTTARFNSPVEDTSPVRYATVTDANIRFRSFQDVLTTNDVSSIFTSKTFLENINVLEKPTIVLNKALADQLTNIEFLDRQFKGIQKPLSDVSIPLDKNVNFLGKRFNEQVSSINPAPVFTLIKVFSDFANPIDLVEIPDGSNYSIEKTIRNTVNTSDTFLYIVNFDRVIEQFASPFDSDVITFTKAVNDLVNTLGDFNVKSINKVLKDTQLISDTDIFALTKPLSDSQTLSDSDTFAFTKSIVDTQSLSDNDTYNLTKVLKDSRPALDNDAYSLTKVLTDSRPALDNDVYSLTKVLTDSRPALDQLTQIIVQKSLADFASAIDLIEIPDGSNYLFDKTLSDIVANIVDDFNRTVDYNRVFADSIFDYTESQVFVVIKALADESPALDNEIISFTKILKDTQEQSDNDAYNLTKVLKDSRPALDNDAYSLTKVLKDSQSQSDNDTYNLTKVLADSQIANEFAIRNFTKSLTDSQLISETITTKSFIKALVDDSFQSDTITNKTFTKALSDFANPIDLIEIPDGSNYAFEKTLRNTVSNINDDFNRTVSFIRSFEDSISSINDNDVLSVNKGLSDSITSSENITQKTLNKRLSDSSIISDADIIVLTKVLSDTGIAADTPAISFSRTLADIYFGFQDNLVNHITKSFSDFITTDDSGFTLIRTSPELPLSDGSTIDDAGSLFMSDYVDATYFAENYVGTERSFT